MATDVLIGLSLELSRLLKRTMASRSHASDCNLLQLHGLGIIEDAPGITMRELADQLKIRSSSATTFVDRLVGARLVTRSTDARNRKITRLRITKKGSNVLHDTLEDKQRVLRDVYAALSPTDRRHLERILGRIIDSFHAQLPSSPS